MSRPIAQGNGQREPGLFWSLRWHIARLVIGNPSWAWCAHSATGWVSSGGSSTGPTTTAGGERSVMTSGGASARREKVNREARLALSPLLRRAGSVLRCRPPFPLPSPDAQGKAV